MQVLVLMLLLFLNGLIQAQEPVTPPHSPIVIYQSTEDYEEVKSNLEMAITGRGMLVMNVLHISNMLERTANDTGLKKALYSKAESIEFCSILMAYGMSEAHPANMANCPLTISIYTETDNKKMVNIAYRRPALLGNSTKVRTALTELLDGIVREALE